MITIDAGQVETLDFPLLRHTPKESLKYLDEYPFGVISDIHGHYDKLIAILKKHPEIKEWYCLGDCVDMGDRFECNDATARYLEKSTIQCLKGNHDSGYARKSDTPPDVAAWLRQLPKQFKINLPSGYHLLAYHSLPESDEIHVNPGFTEREFVDEYPYNENTTAVLIGHNHKQFKQQYYGINCELWSVGAVMYGNYSIISDKGIEFKSL